MHKISQGESPIKVLSEVITKFDDMGFDVNLIFTEGADIKSRNVRHVNQFEVVASTSGNLTDVVNEIVDYLWESCPTARYKTIYSGKETYAYIPLNGKRRSGIMKILNEYKMNLMLQKQGLYESLADTVNKATEAFIIPAEGID